MACAVCGGAGEFSCARCKSALYCSKGCQRRHWPDHKQQCKVVEAPSVIIGGPSAAFTDEQLGSTRERHDTAVAAAAAAAAAGADASWMAVGARIELRGLSQAVLNGMAGRLVERLPNGRWQVDVADGRSVAVKVGNVARASETQETPPDGVACWVCLGTAAEAVADGGNELLQCGCHCRGRNGWAHLECLAGYAAGEIEPDPAQSSFVAYLKCPNCTHNYTGMLAAGMSSALMDKTGSWKVSAEECNGNQLIAMKLYAGGLLARSECTKAISWWRKAFNAATRLDGVGSWEALCAKASLGDALCTTAMERVDAAMASEAEQLLSSAYRQMKRKAEPSTKRALVHAMLSCADSLCTLLNTMDRLPEAQLVLEPALAHARAAFGDGDDHPVVINLRYTLLKTTSSADPSGALRKLCKLILTASRVQGAEHHATLTLKNDLATRLYKLQQHAESCDIYRIVYAIRPVHSWAVGLCGIGFYST